MLYIYDFVLRDIEAWIADHPPERGGALLGPIGKHCVTEVLFDDEARASTAEFQPSANLGRLVQAREQAADCEFKGIVHSHPGGLDRLSGQDHRSIKNGLHDNPHLACYWAPIVTTGSGMAELASHELPLRAGKISFFTAYRTRDSGVSVTERHVTDVPIGRDLARIANRYEATEAPQCFLSDLAGVEVVAGRVVLPDETELLFMVSELYPGLPPVLLMTPPGQPTQQVQLEWRLDVDPDERLLRAVESVISPGEGRIKRLFGPHAGPAYTSDPERARLAGWTERFGGDEDASAQSVRAGLFARSAGLVSDALTGMHVLAVCTGSVGSIAVEQLVRAGVGRATLIDPDTVAAANLSRTVYEGQDIGRPKVEALARRLLQVNPLVELRVDARHLEDFSGTELASLVSGADLVVVATDDVQTQLLANRFAYAAGVPAVFIALFDGAEGGEVIFTVPDDTACYLCSAASRQSVENAGAGTQAVDYSTGRLRAVIALASDIHYVTSAGVKIAVALLARSSRAGAAAAGGFLDEPLASGQTYLLLSMVPRYWFFPVVFGDTPSQYAYQSLWIAPVRRPECPVCGDRDCRESPLDSPVKSPLIDRLRAAARARGRSGRQHRGDEDV